MPFPPRLRHALLAATLILALCTTVLGSNPAPRLLIISFDGFRYNYVNSTITPNLMALRQKGTYAPYMVNVFPTKTFPNHHALATGTYVEHHGVFGSKVIENGTRLTYSERLYTYNKTVLPIWAVNEKAGRHSGAMMWPGGEFTYGDTVATFRQKFDYVLSWENKVETVLQWFKNETTPANVVVMYFDQPDNTSHSNGGDSERTKAQIVHVDHIVSYIEKALTRDQLDDVNVFLLSDHGMADVPFEHFIDLRPEKHPGLKALGDGYFTLGSSPIYQVVPRPGSEEAVYQAFHNLSLAIGNFKVYRKADIPSEWRIKNSTRMTDILVLADVGYGFHDLQEEFNIGPGLNLGVHGFDNKLMEMRPFFQAFGPLIKKAHTIEPFNNIDLFSLWSYILGVEDVQSDGNFNNVRDMLVDSGVSNAKKNWVFLSGVLMLLLKM